VALLRSWGVTVLTPVGGEQPFPWAQALDAVRAG
jgi:hypothetical protein